MSIYSITPFNINIVCIKETLTCTSMQVASSPVSSIFSTHARKEGEPGIQNHVRDVGPYTRVGKVADRDNCMWERTMIVLPH